MPDVLVDTSFLLPTLGVDVAEVIADDLEGLSAASAEARLYCSYASFVEILGLLGKRSKRAEDFTVKTGIKSLLESGIYTWINPSTQALQQALELRNKGHKDNIDNILYSTALDSGLLFLTLDDELKRFLRRNGYDTGIIVGIKGLLNRL